MYTRDDELNMMRNKDEWPGETLCLKKVPKPGEKKGAMGYSTFGIITNASLPVTIYLRDAEDRKRDFSETAVYPTFEAAFEDGWIVD